MRTQHYITLAFIAAVSPHLATAAPRAAPRTVRAETLSDAMCHLGYTAVPLYRAVTGHQLVDVVLDGKPATFVLDTGANNSTVDAAQASEFGISPNDASGIAGVGLSASGRLKARLVKITSLELDHVPVKLDSIAVTDLAELTTKLGSITGGTISGIIGQDVLMRYHAVIDVAGSILYLMPDGDGAEAGSAADGCR